MSYMLKKLLCRHTAEGWECYSAWLNWAQPSSPFFSLFLPPCTHPPHHSVHTPPLLFRQEGSGSTFTIAPLFGPPPPHPHRDTGTHTCSQSVDFKLLSYEKCTSVDDTPSYSSLRGRGSSLLGLVVWRETAFCVHLFILKRAWMCLILHSRYQPREFATGLPRKTQNGIKH